VQSLAVTYFDLAQQVFAHRLVPEVSCEPNERS
jgi:hypothetical protein